MGLADHVSEARRLVDARYGPTIEPFKAKDSKQAQILKDTERFAEFLAKKHGKKFTVDSNLRGWHRVLAGSSIWYFVGSSTGGVFAPGKGAYKYGKKLSPNVAGYIDFLSESRTLVSDDAAELKWAKSKGKQNPFVHRSSYSPHTYSIGFRVPRLAGVGPLWWTGGGFKDLSKGPSRDPEEFETEREAQRLVRKEILRFIQRYRPDDAHLVFGW